MVSLSFYIPFTLIILTFSQYNVEDFVAIDFDSTKVKSMKDYLLEKTIMTPSLKRVKMFTEEDIDKLFAMKKFKYKTCSTQGNWVPLRRLMTEENNSLLNIL